MAKCAVFGCRDERMEGSSYCPLCTMLVERELGRAGFYMHGRDASELYQRAVAILDEETERRLAGQPDPKPRKRTLDPDARSRKLLADPVCRSCGERASDGHHIVLRSQGGDDVEDNIMPLCHECHMAYHAGRRDQLRLTPDEREYLLARLGDGAGDYALRRGLV